MNSIHNVSERWTILWRTITSTWIINVKSKWFLNESGYFFTISQGIWHGLRNSAMNLKRESVTSLEKRLAVHISWLQIQLGSVIEMSEQDLHRPVLLRLCESFIKIVRKKFHFLFNFPVTFNIIHFKIINIHFCALDDPCLPFCHGPWTVIKYIYMKGAPWKQTWLYHFMP